MGIKKTQSVSGYSLMSVIMGVAVSAIVIWVMSHMMSGIFKSQKYAQVQNDMDQLLALGLQEVNKPTYLAALRTFVQSNPILLQCFTGTPPPANPAARDQLGLSAADDCTALTSSDKNKRNWNRNLLFDAALEVLDLPAGSPIPLNEEGQTTDPDIPGFVGNPFWNSLGISQEPSDNGNHGQASQRILANLYNARLYAPQGVPCPPEKVNCRIQRRVYTHFVCETPSSCSAIEFYVFLDYLPSTSERGIEVLPRKEGKVIFSSRQLVQDDVEVDFACSLSGTGIQAISRTRAVCYGDEVNTHCPPGTLPTGKTNDDETECSLPLISQTSCPKGFGMETVGPNAGICQAKPLVDYNPSLLMSLAEHIPGECGGICGAGNGTQTVTIALDCVTDRLDDRCKCLAPGCSDGSPGKKSFTVTKSCDLASCRWTTALKQGCACPAERPQIFTHICVDAFGKSTDEANCLATGAGPKPPDFTRPCKCCPNPGGKVRGTALTAKKKGAEKTLYVRCAEGCKITDCRGVKRNKIGDGGFYKNLTKINERTCRMVWKNQTGPDSPQTGQAEGVCRQE